MFEKKLLELAECEIKLKKNGAAGGQFEGYASTFGNEDSYGDVIEKGAFVESLKKRKPLMLHSHDPRMPIGVWKEAKEDDHGLFVVGELTPGHSAAQDAYASLKHGAFSGMSIGFRVAKGGAVVDDESDTRILKAIDLIEISLVTMPANDKATISGVKAEVVLAIEEMESKRDAELILREAGFSKSAALAFVSRAFRIARSESGDDVDSEIKRILKQAVSL